MSRKDAQVLIGMPRGDASDNVDRMIRNACRAETAVISTYRELESAASCFSPEVVVLSDEISLGIPFPEAVRRVASFAPVVALAAAEKQSELAAVIISSDVDLVSRVGDFAALTAALVERRLNPFDNHSREFQSAWSADLPSDFAETLRHEINNPLTGILGNAELLLAQLKGELPPGSLQRLETVVDLAMRLREKVRRIAGEQASNRESSVHPIVRA